MSKDNLTTSFIFLRFDSKLVKELTHSEREVLNYIEQNIGTVSKMSIHQLASRIFISTGSIMRLCKKLGLRGFSELKYILAEIDTKSQLTHVDVNVKDNLLYEIEQTTALLDMNAIDEIAKVIVKTNQLHLFGLGLSNAVLEYATVKLLSVHIVAINHPDMHIAYLTVNQMERNDVLFIASLSGETEEIVEVANLANMKGVTVISMTGVNRNEVASLADHNLYVYSKKIDKAVIDINSRISFMYVIDILISRVQYLKYGNNEN